MSVQTNFHPSTANVKVAGITIPANCIRTVVVREWVFDVLCRMEILFTDVFNLFETKRIQQFDEVEVELVYDKNVSVPNVKIKFVVTTIRVENSGVGVPVKLYQLNGVSCEKSFILDYRNRSFPKYDSSSVISSVMNKFGKGIVVKNTKDQMNWLQCSSTDLNFVKHVQTRSYNGETDLLYCFVDRFGNFQYRSLNDSCNSESKLGFEFSPISMPLAENANKINYSGFVFCNNAGVSLSYPPADDSVVSHDDSGEMTQDNFYDVSTRLGFKNDNPYVHRTSDKYVNNVIVPRKSGNTFDQYQLNKERRRLVERMFFSNMLVVTSMPHSKIGVMDIVNVDIPVAKTNSGALSSVYSGKYLIGGIIHKYVSGNTYQCDYAMFRNEPVRKEQS